MAEGAGLMAYDPKEQEVVLEVFRALLAEVTRDGGQKRARGEKPPWWRDEGHEAAIFSHLAKWKRGMKIDPDSGVHPMIHAGWRCLAIGYQETRGKRDPQDG